MAERHDEDWELIYMASEKPSPVEAPGTLSTREVLAATKDPNPVIRRLAQEIVIDRYHWCDDHQGDE